MEDAASNVGKFYCSYPANTSVPVRTVKTLASLTLPAGTYVVTAGNEWSVDAPSTFILSTLLIDGATARIERGTMTGGGGTSLAAVVQKDKEFTASLRGYWGTSSNSGSVNAVNIKLDAVRIK